MDILGFGIGEWAVWVCNIPGLLLGVLYLFLYPFFWKTKEVNVVDHQATDEGFSKQNRKGPKSGNACETGRQLVVGL